MELISQLEDPGLLALILRWRIRQGYIISHRGKGKSNDWLRDAF